MTKRRSAHTTRLIAVLTRHPLFWLAIVIVLAFVGLNVVHHNFDTPTLGFIAIAYALACLSIVTRTGFRMWSVLGSGLLATMAGDAIFYTVLLLGNQHIRFTYREDALDLVRALFVAGGAFVIGGLAQEWWADRGNGIFTAKHWRRNRPGVNRNENEGASS